MRNYSGHRKPVVELYSDSDGQYLFSSSKDKSVRVWNLETETEIGEISLSHPGKLSRNIVPRHFHDNLGHSLFNACDLLKSLIKLRLCNFGKICYI